MSIGWVGFLGAAYRRRHFIVLFVASVVVLSIVSTLLRTKVYRAEATLIPPVPGQSSPGVLVDGTLMRSLASQSFAASYLRRLETVAILKSLRIARGVADRLGYADVLELPHRRWLSREAAAAKILARKTTAQMDLESGLVTVATTDTNPVLAADIASAFALELDRHMAEEAMTSAGAKRLFIEERLRQSDEEVLLAQERLQEFQEQHGAVDVGEQAKATIEIAAILEAQKINDEVQLEAERQFVGSSHSTARSLQAKIEALQENIDRITYSEQEAVPVGDEGAIRFYVPLNKIPQVSFRYSQLFLDVKTKEEVLGMLQIQLEQAKIDEVTDLPNVSLLDLAAVPQSPIRPRPFVNVFLAFMAGIVASFSLVFLSYLDESGVLVRGEEEREVLSQVKNGLIASMFAIVSVLTLPIRALSRLIRGA